MIVHDNKLFGDFTNYQCFSKPSCSESSCSIPHGWQSFQNIRQFSGTTWQKLHWLPLIDWLIHWTIYWQHYRHTGCEGPLGISNLTCIQSRPEEVRPAQPLCHLPWKTSKSGVYTPSPVTHPKAASLSLLNCSWEPPLLPFVTASCQTLYHWQEIVSITYDSSFSSFSLGILHPWRYSKVEQPTLEVILF